MPDNVQETTGLDTVSAGSLIGDMLTDDLGVADPSEATQTADSSEKTPPAKKPEEQATDASQETQSEDDQAESGKEGSEDGEEEQEATEGEQEDQDATEEKSQTVTVTIDGKAVEVPLEEAAKGYQRQQDYSRKTQALADDRRAFDGLRQEFDTERQAVTQERAQYKQLLTALHQRITELEPQEPNWQELFARDKNEYLIQRDNWRAYQDQKAAAAAELDRIKAGEAQEFQKASAKQVAAGAAKLLELVPSWKDQSVRQKELPALMRYARDTLGYSEQELQAASDPRALFAVYKAQKWDELQAKAQNVASKAVKPKGKTLAAGGANAQQVPQSRTKQDGMKRLAKSGKWEDAAAIMSNMDL